jgi:hypothetical protein
MDFSFIKPIFSLVKPVQAASKPQPKSTLTKLKPEVKGVGGIVTIIPASAIRALQAQYNVTPEIF